MARPAGAHSGLVVVFALLDGEVQALLPAHAAVAGERHAVVEEWDVLGRWAGAGDKVRLSK